ncbi:immunoglobulin domain-containing protein [candidate division WOR-3 bacterium]|nr:immunoglobulin domain-containing protein [candidate division WOR-3 bacterium]
MKKGLIILAVIVIIGGFYLTGCAKNEPPTITDLESSDTLVTQGSEVTVTCTATDPNDDVLTYTWTAPDGGTFLYPQDSSVVIWVAPAPDSAGSYRIICTVTDDRDESVSDTITIQVAEDYSPKAVGFYWIYKANILLPNDSPDTLTYTATIVDSMLVGDTVYWYIERSFDLVSIVLTNPVDTIIQKVIGNAVWINDPKLEDEYLAFLEPLWVNKSWDTEDGGTAKITEGIDVTVPTGTYYLSLHMVITGGQRGGDEFWLAPNMGIVQTSGSMNIPAGDIDYILKLVEYDTTE